MIKGLHAVKGLRGEITLIDNKMAIMRKYTLARRINCKNKALGKKLMSVYLDVLIKLD
jgi:hypothetical protein